MKTILVLSAFTFLIACETAPKSPAAIDPKIGELLNEYHACVSKAATYYAGKSQESADVVVRTAQGFCAEKFTALEQSIIDDMAAASDMSPLDALNNGRILAAEQKARVGAKAYQRVLDARAR